MAHHERLPGPSLLNRAHNKIQVNGTGHQKDLLISFSGLLNTGWYVNGSDVIFSTTGDDRMIYGTEHAAFKRPILLCDYENPPYLQGGGGLLFKKPGDPALWWRTAENGDQQITMPCMIYKKFHAPGLYYKIGDVEYRLTLEDLQPETTPALNSAENSNFQAGQLAGSNVGPDAALNDAAAADQHAEYSADISQSEPSSNAAIAETPLYSNQPANPRARTSLIYRPALDTARETHALDIDGITHTPRIAHTSQPDNQPTSQPANQPTSQTNTPANNAINKISFPLVDTQTRHADAPSFAINGSGMFLDTNGNLSFSVNKILNTTMQPDGTIITDGYLFMDGHSIRSTPNDIIFTMTSASASHTIKFTNGIIRADAIHADALRAAIVKTDAVSSDVLTSLNGNRIMTLNAGTTMHNQVLFDNMPQVKLSSGNMSLSTYTPCLNLASSNLMPGDVVYINNQGVACKYIGGKVLNIDRQLLANYVIFKSDTEYVSVLNNVISLPYTPADTSTDTPTDTPADTSTDTPADTSTDTPANTSANTPADTSTDTPADTSTDTPTDTPAKGQITDGLIISYLYYARANLQNLTIYQNNGAVVAQIENYKSSVINHAATDPDHILLINNGTLYVLNILTGVCISSKIPLDTQGPWLIVLLPGYTGVITSSYFKIVFLYSSLAITWGHPYADYQCAGCVAITYNNRYNVLVSLEKTFLSDSYLQVLDITGLMLNKIFTRAAFPGAFDMAYNEQTDSYLITTSDNVLTFRPFYYDGRDLTFGLAYTDREFKSAASRLTPCDDHFILAYMSDSLLMSTFYDQKADIVGMAITATQAGTSDIQIIGSVVQLPSELPNKYVGKKIYLCGARPYPDNLRLNNGIYLGVCLDRLHLKI